MFKKVSSIAIILVGMIAILSLVINEMWDEKTGRLADDVRELKFSRESGFYDDEFELEIKSQKGGKIYYTLDSSQPDENSIEYVGPICIDDASRHENVYSARSDASTGYYSELIKEYSIEPDPEYKVPSEKVDKCTVVRAVAVYEDGTRSDVKTASYFVGFNDKSSYDNMNYISIVTDPDNLFDYDFGIYVTGRVFDEYREILESENADENQQNTAGNPYWYQWDSNYSLDYSTEKIASIQFFDKKQNLTLSQKCGIDIHGGGSRGYNPKAFNLKVREEYDGNSEFRADLFGNNLKTSRLVLFAGGNDNYTKSRDYIVNKLTRKMNFTTVLFEPYVLFLDGEYWGVYFLNDKVNDDYLKRYYGVDKDNSIVIKGYKVSVGEESDADLLWELYENLPEDLSNEEDYEKVSQKVDIDSAIDYFAVMCWISRTRDWPNANIAMWRSRDFDTNNYCDCKWRFILYDVNSSSISTDLIYEDSIGHAIGMNPLFAALMTNKGFKQRFLDKVLELNNKEFSKENVDSVIAEFRSLMTVQMKQNNERFFGGEPEGHSFREELSQVEEFFNARREYIPELVEKYR